MKQRHPRMARESRTIHAMVQLYCRDHHGRHVTKGKLCPDCSELFDYAELRLNKCPFQEKKTTCANCRVHCYKPSMLEKVKTVMRYSGPRMTFRHPVLALYHLLDSRKKPLTKEALAKVSTTDLPAAGRVHRDKKENTEKINTTVA